MRTLGKHGPRVSAMGLGCMRMSSFAGPKSNTDAESIATIQAALEAARFGTWGCPKQALNIFGVPTRCIP
jgi:hypothetical protein